ncbi:Post-GPI attachment to proteins factor 2 [Amphibalanus amphitrite]|uniref:Post-GPI attachment to proteins factor 2 n=1 Tax=Amphibalanus amphitrite TaxID=1232801 RepID=A0A6A4X6R7_AMPAM|nr:Post-GPI attachment to proteins factor 2 [Amphibalanus amphitrite]
MGSGLWRQGQPADRVAGGQARVVLVRHLAAVTVLLPLLALTLCYALSLYMHFDLANRTHCLVFNFFPSISSAAGKFSPQKFIWRALLALHLAPRVLLGYLTHAHLARVLRQSPRCRRLTATCLLLYALEQAGLSGVSFVGSLEHYTLHKVSFIVFVAASEAYMVLVTALLSRCRAAPPPPHEQTSLRWKQRLLTLNVFSLVVAMYLFVRHNTYCEPGVYSLFAIFETCMVLSNMAFHFTSYWDFHDLQLCIARVAQD